MLVAFSITPSGSGPDGAVHDAVAAAVEVIRASGLPNRTDSMFTNMRLLGHGQSLVVAASL